MYTVDTSLPLMSSISIMHIWIVEQYNLFSWTLHIYKRIYIFADYFALMFECEEGTGGPR